MEKNQKKQRAIEEQAMDILKNAQLPTAEDVGMDAELLRQLEEADFSELERMEQELGIHELGAGENLPAERSVSGKAASANEAPETDSQVLIDTDVVPKEMIEKVNGTFEIHVSEDGMKATLDLFPPKGGGEPVTFAQVKNRLVAMKIVHGVNEELVKRIIDTVAKGQEEKRDVEIAQGTPPEDGTDGSMEFVFGKDPSILRKDNEEQLK